MEWFELYVVRGDFERDMAARYGQIVAVHDVQTPDAAAAQREGERLVTAWNAANYPCGGASQSAMTHAFTRADMLGARGGERALESAVDAYLGAQAGDELAELDGAWRPRR